MANIKWTGIEQKKYGLTARWYVSAYYGNDTDVDGVGYYNPTTNTTGHGGPTRPFATLDKLEQESNVSVGAVIVFDSGNYSTEIGSLIKHYYIVGDGTVIFTNFSIFQSHRFYNSVLISISDIPASQALNKYDCTCIYCAVGSRSSILENNIFIECSFDGLGISARNQIKNIFVKCSGTFGAPNQSHSNIFILCDALTLSVPTPRESGDFLDYSIIIGTVKTSVPINGKTTGVTIEDFKADGNYFVKSYSEVDLFGNASGSGASVAQINEIFNNYYSPIYIDDWQNADFTLRPNADDCVKFGGLNGTYIGAKPVGYRFSASDLWNTHIDAVNTSNLEYDMINEAIVLQDTFDVGTYRSVRISMPEPITVDLVAFMANFVYNIEGTAKQGVANQRIDSTPDLLPDNTANQRVVYDYKLQTAPNTTDPLSAFKNYELNREPTIDGDGYSQLDDLFDDATEQKQTVQDFIIEFTIRRVIID